MSSMFIGNQTGPRQLELPPNARDAELPGT